MEITERGSVSAKIKCEIASWKSPEKSHEDKNEKRVR
jgi:hypothetical protein